jgi:hypothetical protein
VFQAVPLLPKIIPGRNVEEVVRGRVPVWKYAEFDRIELKAVCKLGRSTSIEGKE